MVLSTYELVRRRTPGLGPAFGVSNLSRSHTGMSLLVPCWTLGCRCWIRTRNVSNDIPQLFDLFNSLIYSTL